jgi:hypothetical protein
MAPKVEATERLGRAQAELRMKSHGSLVAEFPFEAKLDCVGCRRRWRTVCFSALGTRGRCTPTGHEFEGTLGELESHGGLLRASFRYRYEVFVDAKYPDEDRYRGFEAGAPAWVRFRFAVTCSGCGLTSPDSTQTNIVRPWVYVCQCGRPLYEDVQSPILSWEPL